jgi:hypothetical protein
MAFWVAKLEQDTNQGPKDLERDPELFFDSINLEQKIKNRFCVIV